LKRKSRGEIGEGEAKEEAARNKARDGSVGEERVSKKERIKKKKIHKTRKRGNTRKLGQWGGASSIRSHEQGQIKKGDGMTKKQRPKQQKKKRKKTNTGEEKKPCKGKNAEKDTHGANVSWGKSTLPRNKGAGRKFGVDKTPKGPPGELQGGESQTDLEPIYLMGDERIVVGQMTTQRVGKIFMNAAGSVRMVENRVGSAIGKLVLKLVQRRRGGRPKLLGTWEKRGVLA